MINSNEAKGLKGREKGKGKTVKGKGKKGDGKKQKIRLVDSSSEEDSSLSSGSVYDFTTDLDSGTSDDCLERLQDLKKQAPLYDSSSDSDREPEPDKLSNPDEILSNLLKQEDLFPKLGDPDFVPWSKRPENQKKEHKPSGLKFNRVMQPERQFLGSMSSLVTADMTMRGWTKMLSNSNSAYAARLKSLAPSHLKEFSDTSSSSDNYVNGVKTFDRSFFFEDISKQHIRK